MAPLPLVGNSELLVWSLAGTEAAILAVDKVWSFAGIDGAAFSEELPTLPSRLDPEVVAEPPCPAIVDGIALLPDACDGVATANGVTADTGVATAWPLAVDASGFSEKP